MGGTTKELSADDFAQSRSRREVRIEEPEGVVYAESVGLNLGRKLLERASDNGSDGLDVTVILDDLILHGITDSNGDPIFEDTDQIGKLAFKPSMQMAMAVLEESGLTEAADEEIEEKSAVSRAGDSSTS